MTPDIFTITGIAIIVFFAAAVQSAVGFAFALFSTPLLIWINKPLPQAITIVAVSSFLQSSFGARHLRAEIPWRIVAIAVAIRMVMVGAGIIILKEFAARSTAEIKMVIGLVLCILVVIQLTSKIRPAQTVHWLWGFTAFSTSGLLTGLCGMGGPPLILWTLAQSWSVKKLRGFMFSVYVSTTPLQILLLFQVFGSEILYTTLLTLLLLPAVLAGTYVGLPLGNRMPRHILRNAVYFILLIIGLNSAVTPILQYLW